MYEITTTRLGLRKMFPEDAATFFALNSDPEVIRYTGDAPFDSVDAAREFLQAYQEVYQREGYGRWSVCLLSTDECVGWCGLRYQSDVQLTDLGYRFFREWWGRGLATESGAASLAYGFEQLGLNEIIARAHTANTASIRVMEKLGMEHWKDEDMDGVPGRYYRLLRAR